MEGVLDWKSLFFSADGRIGRGEFWIGWLVLLGVMVVAGWIPLLGAIIGLVSIYCSVCIYAKRLHDMGKSGWLQLIPIVVCLVAGGFAVVSIGFGAVMASVTGGSDEMIAASALSGLGLGVLGLALSGLVSLAFLLWVGLTTGEAGPNRFGEPPAKSAMAGQTAA